MGVTRNQRKRKKTHDQLTFKLKLMGYEEQFYLDQVEEYMIYYDNLQTLNEKLLNSSLDTKAFNEILKEKRQVTKEMRNILAFLKLRPSAGDETPSGGSEEDEIL